jgi:hypothetical protein
MTKNEKTPFIHRTRNRPQNVRFTDEFVIIDLADGRAIASPLSFFPRIQAASDSQRKKYQLHHVSVNWEELDEGIDLIAMLTGLYREPVPEPKPLTVHAAPT